MNHKIIKVLELEGPRTASSPGQGQTGSTLQAEQSTDGAQVGEENVPLPFLSLLLGGLQQPLLPGTVSDRDSRTGEVFGRSLTWALLMCPRLSPDTPRVGNGSLECGNISLRPVEGGIWERRVWSSHLGNVFISDDVYF